MNSKREQDAMHAREHPEPVEHTNPVPWLLGLVAASLTVWGVSYFLLNPSLMPGTTAAPGDKRRQTLQRPRLQMARRYSRAAVRLAIRRRVQACREYSLRWQAPNG